MFRHRIGTPVGLRFDIRQLRLLPFGKPAHRKHGGRFHDARPELAIDRDDAHQLLLIYVPQGQEIATSFYSTCMIEGWELPFRDF